jgi:hypothetical protein
MAALYLLIRRFVQSQRAVVQGLLPYGSLRLSPVLAASQQKACRPIRAQHFANRLASPAYRLRSLVSVLTHTLSCRA